MLHAGIMKHDYIKVGRMFEGIKEDLNITETSILRYEVEMFFSRLDDIFVRLILVLKGLAFKTTSYHACQRHVLVLYT